MVEKRIKELKALIAAQEKYNNFFCTKVSDFNTLQSNLSTLQLPTISAIEKLAIQPQQTNTYTPQLSINKQESNTHTPIKPELSINKQETNTYTALFEKKLIRDILESGNVLPFSPENLKINSKNILAPKMIPDISEEEISNKKFLRLYYETSQTEIFFFSIEEVKYLSFNNEIYEDKYQYEFVDILMGNFFEHKITNINIKKFIEIYLKIVKHVGKNEYYKRLKKLIDEYVPFKVIEKEEEFFSGKEELEKEIEIDKRRVKSGDDTKKKIYKANAIKTNPIDLFEKLTLLISAVKSGHNNLHAEIKSLCKKLKHQGLLSNKIYKKYKTKYFQ